MGFDPITMTALAVGGAAVGAFGKLQEGDARSRAANYQAQVAENNKLIAEQNARWATTAGTARETAEGMKVRAGVARLKARQGASGVDVNTGSSKEVTDAASALGSLDAMTIRSNTAREAYGYEVAATSEQAKANLARMEGESAKTSGYIGALSSLLSGASSAGGKYAAWQNVGGAENG
jgi:hypothetical protein